MKLSKLIHIDEDKCVNCHQCISVCPVPCANDGSGDIIKVNEELCIGCGNCLKACTHEARQAIDNFDEAMEALQNKEKIIAIVAPSAAANFPNQYLNLNGWLKSLGVEAFFDVSIGAELTVKSYIEHIKKNNPKMVIAQPCPAIVTYIQVHLPELIKYLAPANSPMVHTMKMIRNYYPQYNEYKILVVSPCTAKKREFDQTGYGDYNVIMSHINAYLKENNIDLKKYPEIDFANDPAERAVLFSTPGGLLKTAEREFPGISEKTRKIEGTEIVYDYLKKLPNLVEKEINPLLVDCLNCELGCNGGTGTDNKNLSPDELEFYINKRKQEMQKKHHTETNEKEALQKLEQLINNYWQEGLYNREYLNLKENYYQNIKEPTEEQIQEILHSMHKYKDEDLKNCASCGYNECRVMAKAIFNNLNKKENCHFFMHYEIDDLNKNLEEKVKKRTQELIKKNEQVIKQKQEILKQNTELLQQQEEIIAQRDYIEDANEKLKEQHKHITQSIQYARTIQTAILPENLNDGNIINDAFIYYSPKDVVSGDFYWSSYLDGYRFVATVDCTGHGVPGAFMSMIGFSLLNQIINEKHILDPSKVLTELNVRVREALKQDRTTNKDGMDLCLVRFKELGNKEVEIVLSSAKSDFFYVKNEHFFRIKGDRYSIGGFQMEDKKFTNHNLKLHKGDVVYMTSDGYFDAANPDRERFGKERFIEMLEKNMHYPVHNQRQVVVDTLNRYQAGEEQRDDIIVIGLQL